MADSTRMPVPLAVAVGVAVLQGVLLVGIAVFEVVAALGSGRVALGLGVGGLFLGYGVLLMVAAWSLVTGASWGRGPVLLTQLIQLGVTWGIRTDAPVVVLVVLVSTAVTAIIAMLHPASVARLAGGQVGQDSV